MPDAPTRAIGPPESAFAAGDPRPRVVHVVCSLEVGGLERVVCDLARSSKAVAPAVICLVTTGMLAEELQARAIPVRVIEMKGSRISILRRICRAVRELRPAILHCHNLLAHLHGSLAARICGVRHVILTKHGAFMPTGGLSWRLSRQLMRRSQVVAVSEEIRTLLRAVLGPKRARSVHYIPNGIALGAYRNLPAPSESRRMLGWPESGPLIGMVARLARDKGHENLLRAFHLVRQTSPESRLVLVGEGPMRRLIEDTVASMGLQGHVDLVGERRDVPQILAALDVFVLPSLSEGVPLTILEAMAAGLPVIATSVGGIPQVVLHEQTGLLVPPESPRELAAAICRLLQNADEAVRLGQKGRQRVERAFSVDQMVARYEDLYRGILTGAEPAP